MTNGAIAAIAAIVAFGIGGAVFQPSQMGLILSFCGSVVVALLAAMKAQKETHDAVNSRMDKLLEIVSHAEFAKGLLKGREESDNESKGRD